MSNSVKLTGSRAQTKKTLEDAYKKDLDAYQEGYESDVKKLNENRSLARQEASINNELLMKYLPELNRQNGLYGLGVSQSANAEALSNYQNSLTNIDRTYNESMDQLNRGKTQYEADLKRGLDSDLLSLYAEQERENREDALSAYADAQDMITAGVGTMTRSDVDQYIKGLSLDEATREKLGALVNYLYGEDTVESKEPPFTVSAEAEVSDGTVTVNVGGVNYKLTLGEEPVSISSKVSKVSKDYENGKAFVYDNGIYVKKNDQVYQVFDENGRMLGDDYSGLYTHLTTGNFSGKPLTDIENYWMNEYAKFKGIGDGTSFDLEDGNDTVTIVIRDGTAYETKRVKTKQKSKEDLYKVMEKMAEK